MEIPVGFETGYVRDPELYEAYYITFVEKIKSHIRKILIIRNIEVSQFADMMGIDCEKMGLLLNEPNCKGCEDNEFCERDFSCVERWYDMKEYFRFLDALSYAVDIDFDRVN